MKVSLSLLADYANLSIDGKLNIMGIFERIVAASVPATHPTMQLVLKFVLEPAERGSSKRIEIKLLDADAHTLMALGSNLEIPPDAPSTAEFPQIAVLNGLTLPAFGNYAFHILINGDTKAIVPFEVIPPPSGTLPGNIPPSA